MRQRHPGGGGHRNVRRARPAPITKRPECVVAPAVSLLVVRETAALPKTGANGFEAQVTGYTDRCRTARIGIQTIGQAGLCAGRAELPGQGPSPAERPASGGKTATMSP